MKTYLSKFLYVISAKKRTIFVLLCLFLLTSVLDALGIGLVGPFMSLATHPDLVFKSSWLHWGYVNSGLKSTSQYIALLGLGIIFVFAIKSLLYFQVQRYIFNFSLTQQGLLRLRLLHGYLTVNYTYHLSKNSASLIQNIIHETFLFCYSVTLPLLSTAANSVVVFALIILLLKTDVSATASILLMLTLAFAFYNRFKDKMAYWGKEGSESDTEMIRIINHSVGGLKETRVIGCESYFESQMNIQAQRHALTGSLFQVFQNLPRIAIEALLVTFIVCFISISLVFNQNPQNLISILSIFAVASIRLIPAASQLMSALGTLRNSSYSLNKLYFDLQELENSKLKSINYIDVLYKSEPEEFIRKSNNLKKLNFIDKISIKQLNYCYPNVSKQALNNLDLTIDKGESIALIGKSGAGKTTLVDVILGLLIPNDGDIKVDGVSIYNDNLRYWQNMIGYIPQSIFLMDDTIERNIAFGVPDNQIDSQQLQRAIKTAQLEELILQLPDGMKTSVGERGVRLSGGQRQRIGIARALYHQREILILDEATSALDNETENLISEAIRSLSRTKTLILIAHRLSTVEHCDRIYVLEHGRIVKSGSYREVVLGQTISS
ncbi:ABC transporter ATP-binding protein [Brasilonema octagenarum]|uniref:ABC transporter ATP-binding protein n=1 Tax=Brasilonema octagenarum UFV-OR1 TaxID=417115 RepID=A0ABX1M340_9CYAN|nr:ABC transporter ATP-binding protein [Brasilonema octagenarum]NMF62106.1 ABC transporter ATP-binding protein [Brasilonema octagenarum UFV-OR1]